MIHDVQNQMKCIFSTSDRTTFLLLDYVTKVRRNTLLLRSLNYPNTRAFVSIIIPTRLELGPFGLHCSTLPFISYSFEYTLRSTRRLNGPTQAQNAQYNLVWAYRSRRMRWHIIMLTLLIYRERKKISFDKGTKTFARIFYLFTTALCAF